MAKKETVKKPLVEKESIYLVVGTFCLTGKGSNIYKDGDKVKVSNLNNVEVLIEQGFLKEVK
tara:strand:- start:655 stop:840 length:186 start_codon:yes stop_codon:yes gene_type:complete